MKTIVISDIHIGYVRIDTKKVVRMLEEESPDKVIVNGDLADFWIASPKEISKDPLITCLVSMAKTKPVIWVRGNHDWCALELMPLPGIPILNDIVVEENNTFIQILHGHSVYSNGNMSWYDKLGAKINLLIYRLIKKDIQRWINGTKFYTKYITKKRKKLLERSDCDVVIIGHTHKVGKLELADKYLLDAGSTAITNSYVVIENGAPRIKFIYE